MQGLCHLLFNYCTCFCFSSVFFSPFLKWPKQNPPDAPRVRFLYRQTAFDLRLWDLVEQIWFEICDSDFDVMFNTFGKYFHLMSYFKIFKGFPELVSYFGFDIALTRQFVFKWFNFLKGLSQVYTRACLTPPNFDSELRLSQLMTGQPTPPKRTPPEMRPYSGLINYWFPLIRPAIKPLFLRGVWLMAATSIICPKKHSKGRLLRITKTSKHGAQYETTPMFCLYLSWSKDGCYTYIYINIHWYEYIWLCILLIISICLLEVYFQKVAQVASAICICDDSTHNKLCNWSLHDSTEDCHSRAAATVLELTSKFCKAKIEMVCRSTYISHVVNYDVMSHPVTFKQGFESFTWIDIIQMAC